MVSPFNGMLWIIKHNNYIKLMVKHLQNNVKKKYQIASPLWQLLYQCKFIWRTVSP